MQSRDYKTAIMTFTALDNSNLLKDNVTLLVTLGQCYHYHGDNKKAVCALHRVSLFSVSFFSSLESIIRDTTSGNKIGELRHVFAI